jgi:choline-sulfatase
MEWVSSDMAVPAASDDAIVSSCLEYLATLPRSSAGSEALSSPPSSSGGAPPQVFLYCSIVAPHPPYWTNSTWLSQVNRSAMAAFLPTATPVAEMHPFDVYQSRSEGVLLGNETREQRLDLAAAYYGRVAMADAMMGSVIAAVNQTFMRDDAFVLFVADHGELALQHSLVEKMSMYEGSGRVPFVVAGPQVDPSLQGTHRTDFVTLLDVFPTILDAAGATELPSFLHGASVMPLVRRPPPPAALAEPPASGETAPPASPGWRQFVTSQFHGEESNTGSFMVRWDDTEGDWKGIFFGTSTPSGYEHYTPRLFELQSDPHELHDLAATRQDKLLQLESMLLSVYDYQEVDRQAKTDQRDAFVRWIQLWPGDQWMNEIAADYIGFEHEDALAIQRWLNETAV